MGSSCCRHKDDSPRVSLSKAFARISHRVFPSSARSVKISDDERRSSSFKVRPKVSEPLFLSSTMDNERNHVTLMLPDAPQVPPRKKKPRLCKKRVSFQSDVDIMSSTKSLEKGIGEAIAEAKVLRRSLDSLLQAAEEEEAEPRFPRRRTSSLEALPGEDWINRQAAIAALKGEDTRLTARLRRDTLGNALDIHSYRRPLPDSTLPGTQEEDSDGSLEELRSGLSAKLRRDTLATIALKKGTLGPMGDFDEEEEEEESSSIEDIPSSALPLKIRRDTLGLALKPGYFVKEDDVEDEEASTVDGSSEDLAMKVQNSKLCAMLRRDTFGDALREAVKSKACSSFEDITELEIDEPKLHRISNEYEDSKELHEISVQFVDEIIKRAEILAGGDTAKKEIDRSKSAWLNSILIEATKDEPLPEKNNNTLTQVPRKVTFTEDEITSVLERMRGVEAKEPYTVVYSSSNSKGPSISSDTSRVISTAEENEKVADASEIKTDASLTVPGITISAPNDPPSRKSSTTSSLQEFESSIYEMLQHEEEKDKRVSVET